jgi:hypothetical protein
MSPRISPVPIISASRLFGFALGATPAGRSSTTGFPYRVMQTGFRVLRTRSTTDKQWILNLDAAISSMSKLYQQWWYNMLRFYHPTGFPLFCSSSQAFSGAK